jgi:hypothetical protein
MFQFIDNMDLEEHCIDETKAEWVSLTKTLGSGR